MRASTKVLVSMKSVDLVYTEFVTKRINVNVTNNYVSIILRNSDDNSVIKEIIRPWHQIKELTIMEVKDNEESSNSADT